MSTDAPHEIFVLLVLVAGYSLLGASVWVAFCGRNTSAVRKLNSALAIRKQSMRSDQRPGQPRAALEESSKADPNLEATLTALTSESRITPKLAHRLQRIRPVFHRGKWVVYPSNAYWSHRFERLGSR